MISDRISATCCEQLCTSVRVANLSERARIGADAGKTRESFEDEQPERPPLRFAVGERRSIFLRGPRY
jgi:hypothetical protein